MPILLVEDNERLSALIKQGLERASFRIHVVDTAADALEALTMTTYELVILDLGLPDEDGMTVLRMLRQRSNATPVLILTARGTLEERVLGLNSGADDYLVKPVALEELVARANALLRRPTQFLGVALHLGNLTLDSAARQVFVKNQPEIFSAREIMILESLLRRSGHVIAKSFLEDLIHDEDGMVSSNAVEVYIHRLRKRFLELGANVQIHTIRGVGYMIKGSS